MKIVYDSSAKNVKMWVDGNLEGTHTYTAASPMRIGSGHFAGKNLLL